MDIKIRGRRLNNRGKVALFLAVGLFSIGIYEVTPEILDLVSTKVDAVLCKEDLKGHYIYGGNESNIPDHINACTSQLGLKDN